MKTFDVYVQVLVPYSGFYQIQAETEEEALAKAEELAEDWSDFEPNYGDHCDATFEIEEA